MKSSKQKLVEEIEKKSKELSRVQEELSQECQKAKQQESQPTSLPMEPNNVSLYVHMYVCTQAIVM